MAFITLPDLEKRMRGGLANVPADVKQDALDKANSTASGYLRSRYTLPFPASTPIPADLRGYTLDLAVWEVLSWRGFNPDSPQDATYRARLEDATAWFKSVSIGRISPMELEQDASPTVSGSAPAVSSDLSRGWGQGLSSSSSLYDRFWEGD